MHFGFGNHSRCGVLEVVGVFSWVLRCGNQLLAIGFFLLLWSGYSLVALLWTGDRVCGIHMGNEAFESRVFDRS